MSTSRTDARYCPPAPNVADGWQFDRLTAPSRLFGANGLRTGPDGRVYIAQVTGSQISALDVDTGRLDTVSAKGGDIIAPDDVAFVDEIPLGATGKIDKKLIRDRMKDYVLPTAAGGGAAALAVSPEPKIYAPEPATPMPDDGSWLQWTPGPDQAVDRAASPPREASTAKPQPPEAPADAVRPFRRS